MSDYNSIIDPNAEPFDQRNIQVVKQELIDGQFNSARYIVVRTGIRGEQYHRSPILTGSEEQQVAQGREWLLKLRQKLLDERNPKPTNKPTSERAFTFE